MRRSHCCFFYWLQREEIRFMIERDGSAKAIVFSQFTSFLDLIHYSLQKVIYVFFIPFHTYPSCCHQQSQQKPYLVCIWQSGVGCVQLDGSMSMTARDSAITRFTEDPDCRIFLMSLKAGGVALNLTVASQVNFFFPFSVNAYFSFLVKYQVS